MPAATPGNATISALGVPEKTSKNGRAITGVPSAPMAPYIPIQNGDWGSVERTGARPGSPASQRLPLAAVISRSDAGAPASGPVVP